MLTLLALALLCAWAYVLYAGAQHPPEPLHNAYWPFSVETSISDR